MNQIKIIIKTNFQLLILVGCIMLVIRVFFFFGAESGMGIFGTSGTTFIPLVKEQDLVNKGADHLHGFVNGYIPIIHYNEGALQKGDGVEFKNLLLVDLENGDVVSGSAETGFVIYLIDIRTKRGNSVLEKMSTDDLANMEEIPSDFVYDEELDMLYIFGSGTYTVMVKIYSDTGGVDSYEFQLLVKLE